jgi:TraX protein
MKTLAPQPQKSFVTASADFVPTLSKGQQETLKWLAILTMTLDHANKLLFNYTYPALLWIGRLAFPLFAFLMAYNLVVREVKPTRYLWPLLLFALGTQPLYMWIWQSPSGNNLFTLYLGVLYVGLHALISQRLPASLTHTLLALLFFLPSLQVDYGPVGVFLLPLLVYFLKQPTLLGYVGLSAYLVAVNSVSTSSIVTLFVSPAHALLAIQNALEPFTFVPLLLFPVVWLVSRLPITLRRSNPWFFYIFYPAHMLLLTLLAPHFH